jgi:hypothetical protein
MGSKNSKPATQLRGSNKPVNSTALVLAKTEASESKSQLIGEVMPPDIFGGCKDVERLTHHYFDDEAKCLEKHYTFFGFPSIEKEILALASNAAPLKDVEDRIKKVYESKDEKSGLLDTLVRARELAIKNLDVDITDTKGDITPGMAETITRLGNQLYKDAFQARLQQEQPALPIESADQKKEREDTNVAAVNDVFNAIKKNDENTSKAIENFKDFVKSRDANPLNRLHLLSVAFDVLANKGEELPSINANDDGRWYGALGDQYCFKVIGDAIEMGVTPRVRQILKTGAYYVLNGTRKVERSLDNGGLVFNFPFSSARLGVDSYYDDSGPAGEGGGQLGLAYIACFKTYYEQLHQHPSFTPSQSSHDRPALSV